MGHLYKAPQLQKIGGWPFFGPKMDQNRVKPQFFGAEGFVLMSQMIIEEKETFFSKNVARNRFFRFGGSDPFIAPSGTPRGPSWLILAIIYYRNSMISRKKGGVKILPAKMSVWLSHRVKRKIVPWFICPVWSSTFVKYPLCQVSKISNDYFCILALQIGFHYLWFKTQKKTKDF